LSFFFDVETPAKKKVHVFRQMFDTCRKSGVVLATSLFQLRFCICESEFFFIAVLSTAIRKVFSLGVLRLCGEKIS
jgi:hypothetical protein